MILDTLARLSRERVKEEKKNISLEEMKTLAFKAADHFPRPAFAFENALRQEGISLICEVKKASPSKGIIARDFPWLEIAKEYEAAGASSISVLTEPEYFLGQNRYLQEISSNVSVPVLRKDFTVDLYQIYQAKALGADAVLLICSLLTEEFLVKAYDICRLLGLSPLTETHTEEEIKMAIRAGASIIGVNNRNLKNFQVDTENSLYLRSLIPPSILFVAESGITSPFQLSSLKAVKADAVLIGEALMRSSNRKELLGQLREACL